MNETLAKFMGLAVTALVIGGLVFGSLFLVIKNESSEYETHMNDNMNDVIQSEMTP
ncbi:MAG: hypothetical protein R3267_02380 [Paenisporosarcina sp.]|nr:hypothetical protein [Paenisporosarcina sp.]